MTLAGNQAQATRTVTVQAAGPLFTGAFSGATKVGDVYTFPSGADSWAGFANDNAALYPISLTHGGKITFTGSAAQDTSIRFLFENAPYPLNNNLLITLLGMLQLRLLIRQRIV